MVGEVFPATLLEKLFRDMYARLTDEHKIQDRIVRGALETGGAN